MRIRNCLHDSYGAFLEGKNPNHLQMIEKKSIPPVFIIGCGRSGSTFLARCIHETGNIFFPPENFTLLKCYNFFLKNINKSWEFQVVSIVDILLHQEMPERWDIVDHKSVINELLSSSEKTLGNIVHTWYSNYGAKKGYPSYRWGCKTPNLTPYIGEMKKIFPSSKVIYIFRDPNEVIQSFMKSNLKGYNNKGSAEAIWYYVNNKALNQAKKFGFLLINFNDLISNHKMTMDTIQKFIGYDLNQEKVSFDNEDLDLDHMKNVKKDLYHHKYQTEIEIHNSTKKLYKALLSY